MANLVAALMEEKVNWGGIAATRIQVYETMGRLFPDNPQTGIGSADWWAFGRDRITEEEAHSLIPWGRVCNGCSGDLREQSIVHLAESMCHSCWLQFCAD